MKKIIFSYLILTSVSCLANTTEIKAVFEEAERGSKSAIYELGVRYGSGDGIKEDHEIANQYYEQSATLGYGPAQNNLGWSYRQGIGVKKNPSLAIYWFRLSALQRNALALQNLAEMFQQGEGVARDLETARSFFILCATEAIGEVPYGVQGTNNAIHECRREVGKIEAMEAKDDQYGLKRAAMWLSVALTEDKDVDIDSEAGLRARRSRKETEELLNKINEKLNDESRQWVNDVIKNWDDLRMIVNDRTPFPLIHEDCFNSEKSL